jgi:hypothetical protein
VVQYIVLAFRANLHCDSTISLVPTVIIFASGKPLVSTETD